MGETPQARQAMPHTYDPDRAEAGVTPARPTHQTGKQRFPPRLPTPTFWPQPTQGLQPTGRRQRPCSNGTTRWGDWARRRLHNSGAQLTSLARFFSIEWKMGHNRTFGADPELGWKCSSNRCAVRSLTTNVHWDSRGSSSNMLGMFHRHTRSQSISNRLAQPSIVFKRSFMRSTRLARGPWRSTPRYSTA